MALHHTSLCSLDILTAKHSLHHNCNHCLTVCIYCYLLTLVLHMNCYQQHDNLKGSDIQSLPSIVLCDTSSHNIGQAQLSEVNQSIKASQKWGGYLTGHWSNSHHHCLSSCWDAKYLKSFTYFGIVVDSTIICHVLFVQLTLPACFPLKQNVYMTLKHYSFLA